MHTEDTRERRAYYRIQDRIALQIADAGEDDPDSRLFSLLSELHLLEQEAKPLLRSISEQQRTLSSYLKITNQRIDLLASALTIELLQEFGTPQQVTLSEDSISFSHSAPLCPDSLLTLRLILLPQTFGLQVKARVLKSEATTTNTYQVVARFHALDETQRKVLARHIMHKQARQRRKVLAKQEKPHV